MFCSKTKKKSNSAPETSMLLSFFMFFILCHSNSFLSPQWVSNEGSEETRASICSCLRMCRCWFGWNHWFQLYAAINIGYFFRNNISVMMMLDVWRRVQHAFTFVFFSANAFVNIGFRHLLTADLLSGQCSQTRPCWFDALNKCERCFRRGSFLDDRYRRQVSQR